MSLALYFQAKLINLNIKSVFLYRLTPRGQGSRSDIGSGQQREGGLHVEQETMKEDQKSDLPIVFLSFTNHLN